MSAISNLIAAVRGADWSYSDQEKWVELADAAEKELAGLTVANLKLAEMFVGAVGEASMWRRIDLEALRKALEVSLDPFTYGGASEWHEARSYLRKVKCDLAQLNKEAGHED